MTPELHLTAAIWCGQKEKKKAGYQYTAGQTKGSVFLRASVVLSACPLTGTAFLIVASKCHFLGGTELNGAGELNVPREAVGTQPICESETLFVIASLCQDRGCTCQII